MAEDTELTVGSGVAGVIEPVDMASSDTKETDDAACPYEEAEEVEDEGFLPDEEPKKSEGADSITTQYTQALEQVDSFVPAEIASAFAVLDTRIQVINQSLLTTKTESLVAWEQVKPALYYQL